MKHYEPYSDTEVFRKKGININTILIGAFGLVVSVLLTVLGFMGSHIITSVDSMQVDVYTLKAQLPEFNKRVDALQASQDKMWQRLFDDSPSTIKPPINR